MAQDPTGLREAMSESTLEGDPEIHYELRTTGLPEVPTADIPQSLDSTNLRLTRLQRLSNRIVQFHGKEDFCVTFNNSSQNKSASCTCSNAAQCSHVYYSLNQLAHAYCHGDTKQHAVGVIYPRGKDRRGQRASIEIDGEDVWPLPAFKDPEYASFVSAYIHRRSKPDEKKVEKMEESLFKYNRHTERHENEYGKFVDTAIKIFSDRPIYAATQTSLERVIAEACVRDEELKGQMEAILTPAKQTAIKLEDLQCALAQELAALSESWLGKNMECHERWAKRCLDRYAYKIFSVYRVCIDEACEARENGEVVNTSEATEAAASALVFVIQSAVDRSRIFRPSVTSLWRELTLTDYGHHDPVDFWTNFFSAFWVILQTPERLAEHHRQALHDIRERAIELRTPCPGILDEMRRIIRA